MCRILAEGEKARWGALVFSAITAGTQSEHWWWAAGLRLPLRGRHNRCPPPVPLLAAAYRTVRRKKGASEATLSASACAHGGIVQQIRTIFLDDSSDLEYFQGRSHLATSDRFKRF